MEQAQFWLSDGTVVGGRYRLEKVLGIGHLPRPDMRLERLVAVKESFPGFWGSRFADRCPVLRCQAGMEEPFQKGMGRFLDEAKALVQLSDISGVVRVSGFFRKTVRPIWWWTIWTAKAYSKRPTALVAGALRMG